MEKAQEKQSQSPQIGSMFLTSQDAWARQKALEIVGRNPLKSGQCFLRNWKIGNWKIGKMEVAIPSNRVNVSYQK